MDPPMTPAAANNRILRPRTPSQISPFTHRPTDERRVFNNPPDAIHSVVLSEAADWRNPDNSDNIRSDISITLRILDPKIDISNIYVIS